MGKLSGLDESLRQILRQPAARTNYAAYQEAIAPPEDTRLIDALSAIVEAVSNMPQAKLDVAQLVKAVKGIKLPESKPIDLTPIVEAISKIELEVEFPEHKAPVPCAYTFTVQRNEMGVMTGVIATPGAVETPAKIDTAEYE